MADIRFYHLMSTPLERALPQLLEKAFQGHFRVLVKAADEAIVDMLNTQLWTYSPTSFLPHGSAKDGSPDLQPIFLTTTEENLNDANLLAITDGTIPQNFEGFERVIDLFDGKNEPEVEAARERWKHYKSTDHTLQYWQQTESGSWEQKA